MSPPPASAPDRPERGEHDGDGEPLRHGLAVAGGARPSPRSSAGWRRDAAPPARGSSCETESDIDEAEIGDDVGGAERVIEEAAAIEDAGFAVDGSTRVADDLAPDAVDARILGEEAVGSDVDALTPEVEASAHAADLGPGLEDLYLHPELLKTVGGGESGRSGADDANLHGDLPAILHRGEHSAGPAGALKHGLPCPASLFSGRMEGVWRPSAASARVRLRQAAPSPCKDAARRSGREPRRFAPSGAGRSAHTCHGFERADRKRPRAAHGGQGVGGPAPRNP